MLLKISIAKSQVENALSVNTTQWSSIAGDWQTLIIVFFDGSEYRLRPLFFAYEDSQHITNLIVETYKILAAAVTVTCNTNVTAALLWENIDALMTDSVAKNLKTELSIAEQLGSDHMPYHLLCKRFSSGSFIYGAKMKATNHPKGNFPRWQFLGGYCQGAVIFAVIVREQSSGGNFPWGNNLGGNHPGSSFSWGQLSGHQEQ